MRFQQKKSACTKTNVRQYPWRPRQEDAAADARPVTDLPARVLRELFDYWSRKRRAAEVPDRADLDPVDVPGTLPHLYLLNVLPGPEYEFRLIGTALVSRLGFDPTGRKVRDVIAGNDLDYMNRLFARAVESRRAIYSRSHYRFPPKGYLRVHRIILPLTRGGGDIAMLIVGQVFEDDVTTDRKAFHALVGHGRPGGDVIVFEEFEMPDADDATGFWSGRRTPD